MWIKFKYVLETQLKIMKKIDNGRPDTKQMRLNTIIFDALLIHPRFISFFLHLTFTLLGLLLNDPFFYTLNLFLITNQFKTINYILKSIIKNYGKLIVTFLFTILVIFCYSFILFLKFKDDENEDFPNLCNTFSTCFFNSINLGLRLGGGISDALDLSGNPSTDGFYWRFFFDLTFFIFIKLIFLNLIAGIIIDTFSEMRDEMTKRKYHLDNICTICGKTKFQLEKEGELFYDHLKKTHNIWGYLSYIVRLLTIRKSSFNGLETYIFEKTDNDDSSWIPQNVYLKKNKNYKRL